MARAELILGHLIHVIGSQLCSPSLRWSQKQAWTPLVAGMELGDREMEDPTMCHAVKSRASWEGSRWDWFCQKGPEVAPKSELPLNEKLMSGI